MSGGTVSSCCQKGSPIRWLTRPHSPRPEVSLHFTMSLDGFKPVRTHQPEDADSIEGVTYLSCDVGEAAQIARSAAGGKNLEGFAAAAGTHPRPCPERRSD